MRREWPVTGIITGHSFTRADPVDHHLETTPAGGCDTETCRWPNGGHSHLCQPRYVRVTCTGCPGWSLALEPGHSAEDYQRLAAMHSGEEIE